MALRPHTTHGGGIAPSVSGGTHRRGGSGRPEFRRIAAGFVPATELTPAPVVVNGPGPPGPIVDLPVIASPGFSAMRFHVNMTNAAPGGQLSFALIELDPTTGAETAGLLATPLILDTGPLGVGVFDSGGSVGNLMALGNIFSTWLWRIRVRQALAGGNTTINSAKLWLSRMF